jgi:hypothetical protein
MKATRPTPFMRLGSGGGFIQGSGGWADSGDRHSIYLIIRCDLSMRRSAPIVAIYTIKRDDLRIYAIVRKGLVKCE